MLELYVAYWDYKDMMAFVEETVSGVAIDVLGTTEITYQGRSLSLAAPWEKKTMAELTSAAVGEDVSVHSSLEKLSSLLLERNATVEKSWGTGRLLAELFELTCETDLWDPIFVTEHPVEVSPLARRHRDDEALTERFESYAVGRELSNGFSELTDPDDQRKRFEDQARLAAAGDEEAMGIDEDYIRSLEWGLPPTAGLGIGIDRLVMLLADVSNIREVIAFPTLKPLRD
jgi:lysyl-tRNA synthetase class 2